METTQHLKTTSKAHFPQMLIPIRMVQGRFNADFNTESRIDFWVCNTMLGPMLLRTLVNQSGRRYNTYQLVVKELWLRKQTSPLGCALGIGSFTAIIP